MASLAQPTEVRLPPGNEPVRRRLVALSQAGRLHHCLLFEGPAGVGKAATARWLAMLANCTEPEGGGLFGAAAPRSAPCGTCWSCRHIARGEHPDVIEVGLDPEKATPIISVDQARALLSRLVLHPFAAQRRFVIIDPADAMTAEAANALLKTLEEPPTQTGFVLVTARASGLLPTVRSRSQRVRFGPVAVDRVAAWLEEDGVADAFQLAILADGRPTRARELAQGERQALVEARDQLVEIVAAPAADRQRWAELLARGDRADVRARVDRVLEVLSRLLRDCLLLLDGGPPRLALYNVDRADLVAAWSARLGASGIAAVDAALAETRAALDANVQVRLAMDALLARLRRELGERP